MPPSTTSSDGPELASVCFIRERGKLLQCFTVLSACVPMCEKTFRQKTKISVTAITISALCLVIRKSGYAC